LDLFRNVQSGSQYHSLFPQVACERVPLGKGDTDYSIDKMVEWIIKHQNQTTKIAAKLEKSSLQQTCSSIHDFLFNHFQYKADDSDQLLRSPACAWVQRYDGIDCKSYSIIASSLLLNLGINHYIRKVAYTMPGEYSHVYVIVPKNQKTNNLDDGFYMIDGTINTMQEPYYLDYKDEYMSLAHYGLNRPNYHQLNGFNLDILKKISINNLKDMVRHLDCIGGTAYTPALYDANVNKLNALANEIIDSINKSIASDDMVTLAEDYIDFVGIISTLYQGHAYKAHFDSWNSCTDKRLRAFVEICAYFVYDVHPALTAFIDKYYDKTKTGTKTYTNQGLESQGWTFMEMPGRQYIETWDTYSFKLKSGITQVPAFEFTQPLLDATSSNPVNIQDFLNSLQTIIHVVSPQPNNGVPGGTYTTEVGGVINSNNPQASKMGTNLIIGAILAFAAYKLVKSANNSKSNNNGK